MGYDDMSGPNMKLSRALLIVLVLHIVAVSGIVAFNAIKTRQGSFVPRASASTTSNVIPAAATIVKSEKPDVQREEARPLRSPAKSIAKHEKIEHAKASERSTTPIDSGKVYVVVKGDNPVTIAKKLKVAYDDLIQLNHVDDPRKLQIGTKLLIPTGSRPKKNEE